MSEDRETDYDKNERDSERKKLDSMGAKSTWDLLSKSQKKKEEE